MKETVLRRDSSAESLLNHYQFQLPRDAPLVPMQEKKGVSVLTALEAEKPAA